MSEIKVTMTLPTEVGERFRAMCHKRSITASDMMRRWIFEHDDNGQPIPRSNHNPAPTSSTVSPRSVLDGLFDD